MNDYLNKGREILQKLKENNFEAFFVGGFVRDKLLGITSEDIDITTSATPDEVIALFKHVKETGKKYGTVTILKGEFKFEVTTFRSDGEYVDKRRPTEVTYSKNIEEDLSRRDFTINALIMDEEDNINDYHNGLHDLKHKLIKTINNPMTRFKEDALRMLRAFRFVSKLGFDIDDNTFEAIKELKSSIKDLAIERVMVELEKIIKGTHRNKAFKLMLESGVADELYGIKEGIEHVSKMEEEVYPLEFFIIAFVLNDMDDVWKFSNNEFRIIQKVYNLHEVTKEDVFNKFIVYVNKLEGCLLTNRINVLLGYADQEELIRTIHNELPIHDVCDLKFKGQDIIWLTELRKKSWIGIIVDDLKYNVIMGLLPNEYEPLKEYALIKVEELIKEMGDQE